MYVGSGAGLSVIITLIIVLFKLKCLNCYHREPSTVAETGTVLYDNSNSSDASEEEIVHYEVSNLSGDIDTKNIVPTRLRSE